MREKTNVYFLSEIIQVYSCDCILLENIDSNGNIRHALIDTGIAVYYDVVCKFLEKHKVHKLEFLFLTHSHIDHTQNAVSVLEKYPVDKLIMKEFDNYWCEPEGPQYQRIYERIVSKAIEKNIKILGISYESLVSDEYSPSRSDNFKSTIVKAKKENFEFFNEKNTSFNFGGSFIEIMNWEIFNTEGNLFFPGQLDKDGNKIFRDTYTGDNQNSLGILLYQGNKKAFFAGDMNNVKKNVGGELIGDEDRLKTKIGKIDLLKLGHHGYAGSNLASYMDVISPEYAIITNHIGEAYYYTMYYLEKHNIKYLYTTNDKYEVCAIIYNDEVTIGFGTAGIKKVKDKIFYIPENKIYADYFKCQCKVEYQYTEKSVNNWNELKTLIEEYEPEEGIYIPDNCYIGNGLIINLNIKDNNNIYMANSTININNLKNIKLISKKDEIIIKRDESLIDSPVFSVFNSVFILGEENMKGKIIIDGNKDNVTTTSQLIQIKYGEFSMYDNIILQNNYHKILNRPNISNYFLKYGSAILGQENSKINIYGGEISNNIQEIYIDKNMEASKLPENMNGNLFYDSRGTGIYLYLSILNIFGGKICNNEGINNTEIYSNKNSTNNDNTTVYSLNKRCFGTGIFAEACSKISLYKGEISNNISLNNAKTFLITPVEGKITNLNSINDIINGSALFCDDSQLEIYNDFKIQNNSSKINAIINIAKNCFVKSSVNTAIRGGQIYLLSSRVKINGGIIRNSSNVMDINSYVEPDDDGKKISFSATTLGGGIQISQCKNFEINNLKLLKCNGDFGGGIHIASSDGKFHNTEFSNNIAAKNGGAIFIDSNSTIELNNIKIMNNIAKNNNGGGIFDYGELKIDGENNLISNNDAELNGGGIYVIGKALINNCRIFKNRALKKSGGGLYIEGELLLNKTKIYDNWCNLYGGGVYYTSEKGFIYNQDIDINELIYNNKAGKKGDNIYPLIK